MHKTETKRFQVAARDKVNHCVRTWLEAVAMVGRGLITSSHLSMISDSYLYLYHNQNTVVVVDCRRNQSIRRLIFHTQMFDVLSFALCFMSSKYDPLSPPCRR